MNERVRGMNREYLECDRRRVAPVRERVLRCLRRGDRWTPARLEAACDANWATVSAKLRDLRKAEHGRWNVQRARRAGSGTWEYWIDPARPTIDEGCPEQMEMALG